MSLGELLPPGTNYEAFARVIGQYAEENEPDSLREYLRRLLLEAQLPTETDLRTTIVAFDREGGVITFAPPSAGTELGSSPEPWLESYVEQLGRPDSSSIRGALPLSGRPVILTPLLSAAGSLAGALISSEGSARALSSPLRTCLSTAVVTGVAATNARQMQRLHTLSFSCLEATNDGERVRWDLKRLVKELKSILAADAATLLINEFDELHLAATTDARLSESARVVYRSGEGLTGWIMKNQKSLRLRNSNDRAEVYEKTGLLRDGPKFRERDEGGHLSGQFMGSPLRLGRVCVGVVRVSRLEDSVRFSAEDERALSLFGELLGVQLGSWQRHQVARAVLDSISEGLILARKEVGSDGAEHARIVWVNQGASSLLGHRNPGEIIGRKSHSIYADGEYEPVKDRLRRLTLSGGNEHPPIGSRLRRADDTTVPAAISYHILPSELVEPPNYYTLAVARDQTDSERLAQQQKQFDATLDILNMAYFRADCDGFTTHSSEADGRIMGYEREELRRFPRRELYSQQEDRDWFLQRVRRNGGKLTGALLRMKKKSGARIWVEGDARILFDGDKEVGLEGFYRDVTERVELQLSITGNSDRLLSDHELFDRLKQEATVHRETLSNVGHQIQGPLSGLIGSLEGFKLGKITADELLTRLPYLVGQARVCGRSARNLSYLDLVVRGEDFPRAPLAVRKLAIETKLDFLHLLQEKLLTLDIDDQSLERHLEVVGHQELVRQVLVNLVDNAIKYSAPRSTIRMRAQTWRDGRVLEISNCGFRIPPEFRGRVFDRGFRTPRARAHIPHGTGLGLWLVREILRAHKSRILCDEVEIEGRPHTVFRIIFPHPRPQSRRSQ